MDVVDLQVWSDRPVPGSECLLDVLQIQQNAIGARQEMEMRYGFCAVGASFHFDIGRHYALLCVTVAATST